MAPMTVVSDSANVTAGIPTICNPAMMPRDSNTSCSVP